MNGIDFLDGLNDIDLAYVKEAEEESLSSGIRWQHYASLAACLALMVTSGLMIALGVGGQTTPADPADGVASLIGSAKGVFWMLLIVGAIGVAVTAAVMMRHKNT